VADRRQPLRGDLEADLRARDVTINAMAQPLAGGELVDPTGGREDLAAGRLRAASPTASPTTRCARCASRGFACELDLRVDPGTAELARASAADLERVAPERVLAELKKIVASPRPRAGVELAAELGVLGPALPELACPARVEQNRYHHLDVFGHNARGARRHGRARGRSRRRAGRRARRGGPVAADEPSRTR